MRYLIGIGTYTALDDSIGLRVAEAVREEGLERGFRAVELGGNLLDLTHYLSADTESVLIVDSARMGLAPGDLAFFGPEEVQTRKSVAGFSTHEDDLMKVIDLVRSLGADLPPITLMGIEPEAVSAGVGLSATLGSRFREYVDAAVGFFAPVV